jgi:carboxyl-terminal processing protease
LRGHLKGETKDEPGKTGEEESEPKEEKEQSGSSAYVPKEPEKDTQLQYAFSFLRGTATGPTVAKPADQPSTEAVPNKSAVPN